MSAPELKPCPFARPVRVEMRTNPPGWAVVDADGRFIAERYANADADFIAAAINAYSEPAEPVREEAAFTFAPAKGETLDQMLVRWDAQVAWLREQQFGLDERDARLCCVEHASALEQSAGDVRAALRSRLAREHEGEQEPVDLGADWFIDAIARAREDDPSVGIFGVSTDEGLGRLLATIIADTYGALYARPTPSTSTGEGGE